MSAHMSLTFGVALTAMRNAYDIRVRRLARKSVETCHTSLETKSVFTCVANRPRTSPSNGDQPVSLPPGTTSLLARLTESNKEKVQKWLLSWLTEYVFSAQATLSVPVSMDVIGGTSLLLFYASSGEVRGVLSLAVERERNESESRQRLLVRVTSSSRFVNPSGQFSASLPGERKVIRTLFADLEKDFCGNVQILYKPGYIRLKQKKTAAIGTSGKPLVTVFVGEVRGVAIVPDVISFLHDWATRSQFGDGFGRGFLGSARTPPLSIETTPEGLRIRSVVNISTKDEQAVEGSVSEHVIKVRKKSEGRKMLQKSLSPEQSVRTVEHSRGVMSQGQGKHRVMVIASSTNPDDTGTTAIFYR